ncbi:MAG: tRNA methyltransferase, partial [Proteobacteria bacterium]|nr:tRNA methyltransferase [Pseudomonadota bacterium]
IARHLSFETFMAARGPGRLVLLTTHADVAHIEFQFRADDTLMLGRESAGVPTEVHTIADARVGIPIRPGLRSLNIAVAAAIGLAEALRQTGGWPAPRLARQERP